MTVMMLILVTHILNLELKIIFMRLVQVHKCGVLVFHFSFFKFKKVSANTTENCKITSSDYGDNGWVGLATYYVNPKTIKLNEWYHINYSHYNYTAYKRTAIHEFGHLHGLDHVDCPDEIMSNNSSRDIYQVTLGDGDKAGIVDIY